MSTTINTQISQLSSQPSGGLAIYEVSRLANLELDPAEKSAQDFQADEILTKICQAKDDAAKTKFIPQHLRDLLASLEVASHENILTLWESSRGYCESAKETLEKILPWCQSAECSFSEIQV